MFDDNATFYDTFAEWCHETVYRFADEKKQYFVKGYIVRASLSQRIKSSENVNGSPDILFYTKDTTNLIDTYLYYNNKLYFVNSKKEFGINNMKAFYYKYYCNEAYEKKTIPDIIEKESY